MGLFKKIVSAYRSVKQAKNVCCDNLSEVRNHINSSIEEYCDNLHIKVAEERKNMYEEFKSKGIYTDLNALNDCLEGRITQKEYDEHSKNYKKFVEEKIKEVDEGKISHRELFDLVLS